MREQTDNPIIQANELVNRVQRDAGRVGQAIAFGGIVKSMRAPGGACSCSQALVFGLSKSIFGVKYGMMCLAKRTILVADH